MFVILAVHGDFFYNPYRRQFFYYNSLFKKPKYVFLRFSLVRQMFSIYAVLQHTLDITELFLHADITGLVGLLLSKDPGFAQL